MSTVTVYACSKTVWCEWFALCDRPTDTALMGPQGTPIPCCERCAERVGINITTGEEL